MKTIYDFLREYTVESIICLACVICLWLIIFCVRTNNISTKSTAVIIQTVKDYQQDPNTIKAQTFEKFKLEPTAKGFDIVYNDSGVFYIDNIIRPTFRDVTLSMNKYDNVRVLYSTKPDNRIIIEFDKFI